jgi:hypothetical protein
MGIQQRPPRLVAKRCRPLGRADDVDEQQGGEDAIDLTSGRSPVRNSIISSIAVGEGARKRSPPGNSTNFAPSIWSAR